MARCGAPTATRSGCRRSTVACHTTLLPGNLLQQAAETASRPKAGRYGALRADRGHRAARGAEGHRVAAPRAHQEQDPERLLGHAGVSRRDGAVTDATTTSIRKRSIRRCTRRARSAPRRSTSIPIPPAMKTSSGCALTTCRRATSSIKAGTADGFPRFVVIVMEQSSPYFLEAYSVDSANNGPYGKAITEELIPYLEKKFRLIPQALRAHRRRRFDGRLGDAGAAIEVSGLLRRRLDLQSRSHRLHALPA